MKASCIHLFLATTGCVYAFSSIKQSFAFTGKAAQVSAPAGTRHVFIDLFGASGSDTANHSGGRGGHIQCLLDFTFESTMYIIVGGQGAEHSAGFNGGGFGTMFTGGGGGGATDVRIGNDAIANRVVSAGGGGGACINAPGNRALYGGVICNDVSGGEALGRGMNASAYDLTGGGGGGGESPGPCLSGPGRC